MAVKGLVLRQNLPEFSIVSDYYHQAGREPTRRGPLPIDRVDVFNNNFKHLCEQILAKRRSHIVIVAHGIPEMGLIMPLAAETQVSAGYCMKDLVTLIDLLDAANGGIVDSEALRGYANDWGVTEKTAMSLAKTCRSIRQADGIAIAVHVRGCDIGSDIKHLRNLQRVFNASVVSGPNCPMFFVRAHPGIVKNVMTYADTHAPAVRRSIYQADDKGRLLLDIAYLGAKATNVSAIEKFSDIHKWASVLLENKHNSSAASIPLAGLWPHDNNILYWLAHESGYIDRLVAVTNE